MFYAKLKSMFPASGWLSSVCSLAGAVLISLGFSGDVFGQVAYPFELPGKIHAELSVDTSKTTPVNPELFGLNCSWPETCTERLATTIRMLRN
jgi:hypothetical protein